MRSGIFKKPEARGQVYIFNIARKGGTDNVRSVFADVCGRDRFGICA